MKRVVTNQAGNWDTWTEVMKQELEKGFTNQQVGEKKVFENDKFIIWSIHLPAGQSLPFHKHCKRYFWTALSDGKSRSFYNDGSVLETEYESGSTIYFPDLNEEKFFVHNLENTGDTTLIFTTVEFLD